ncbi:hypothetical protein NUU61_008031 [Penicillium alfredii]|uniref:Uncharacterized protein n=1 Tax=Penicillium alfredii TaxID=1506179 RepID=A0A9W9ERW7_9EURO|nr:uncharacterized protein NUU61_008031 [Penicillium alfredii]KAJ5086724.1 hypothetical protein NUU61_008031 [Penicillium alfredii]
MPADIRKLDEYRLPVLRIIPNLGGKCPWEAPITVEINVRLAEGLPTAPKPSLGFSRNVSGALFPLRQGGTTVINFGRQGEE